MEALAVLEKKITDLVELVSRLRSENGVLLEENLILKKKIESLEVLSVEHKKENEHEKEITKVMVDSLIRGIDAIVEQEH